MGAGPQQDATATQDSAAPAGDAGDGDVTSAVAPDAATVEAGLDAANPMDSSAEDGSEGASEAGAKDGDDAGGDCGVAANPNGTACDDLTPTCSGGDVTGTWAFSDSCAIGNACCDYQFNRTTSSTRTITLKANGTYTESGDDYITYLDEVPKSCLNPPTVACSSLASTSTESASDNGNYCQLRTANTSLYDGVTGTYTVQDGVFTLLAQAGNVVATFSYCVTAPGADGGAATLTMKTVPNASGATFLRATKR
jgi:hypothetical protein